ncbi:MAG: hydrogenase [Deltaproteobacteria bacterium HGW-Deltaproteobacteria-14]|jgi:hydrogenase-4 component E|nr:MAG: hydrogenase [Deltaproteobacteria bacterium HGW-Deltaproteobacteria-14]
MASLLDALLVLVLVVNLYALGTSRIAVVIRLVAIQGLVLGALPLLAHHTISLEAVVISVAAVALKGVIIPVLLYRALREVERREVEPLISTGASMLLGGLGAALALAFTGNLPLTVGDAHHLVVPAALATVLTGFILLTTRLKAISQVLGYLVLENGIFIFGLVLVDAIPLIVEIGALLDLVVAIFVMGIMLTHIRREFASTDTRALSALKEE